MYPKECSVLLTQQEPCSAVRSAFAHLVTGDDIAHASQISAFHEACHVVAHRAVSSEVDWVSILADGDAAGRTKPKNDALPDEANIITLLAGVFAVCLTEDIETASTSCSNDVGHALYSVFRLETPKDADPFDIILLPARLAELLNGHWEEVCEYLLDPACMLAIKAIACALLEHGHLDAAQIELIVATAESMVLSDEAAAALVELRTQILADGKQKLLMWSRRFLDESGARLDPQFYSQFRDQA